MMGREEILNRLKTAAVAPTEHPGVFQPPESKQNLRDQFLRMSKVVGGNAYQLPSLKEAGSKIKELYKNCQTIVNTSSKLQGYEDDAFFEKPQDLNDVDLAIVDGQFGVAENGAIWVTVEQMKHRSVLFLSQHLVVLLSKENLAATMHHAYEKLQLPMAGFGVFLAGPSKTADIEQSLVIGAHGARSLSVFLF